MRHSNQIGIFWQVEIRAIWKVLGNQGLATYLRRMLAQRASNVSLRKMLIPALKVAAVENYLFR